jgi:hypothetical protein
MVDHCGQGLFHRIAWQNRPIQTLFSKVVRTAAGASAVAVYDAPRPEM